MDIKVFAVCIDHLRASLTYLSVSLCVCSFGELAPGSLQGNHIDSVGMVTTVRGQAGHPIHSRYRVSYYGTETEGRTGTQTHTPTLWSADE